MVDKDFCNYFMHPQVIEGIGEVYPIKIKEYNEYGVDMKTIYIEDRNTYFIHCMFCTQIEVGNNGISYKMSDIFCQYRN